MAAIDRLPCRTKYYLSDWKQRNIGNYSLIFGSGELKDLDLQQIQELYRIVTKEDRKRIKELNIYEAVVEV